MPSSRADRSGSGRKKFPTKWTPWEWNPTYVCYSRWRQVAENRGEDDIEYEYKPASDQTPRDQPPDSAATFKTINIEEQQLQDSYTSTSTTGSPPDNNYTYGRQGVDDLTRRFQQQAITTPSYYTTTPVQYTSTPAQPTDLYHSQPLVPQIGSTRPLPFQPYNAGGQTSTLNDGFATPSPENQRRISTANPTSKYDLDRNFKLHRSHEFKFGRVFKVLWSEPTGTGGTEITRPIGNRKAKFGETAYDSVRRFVIIREGEGHCICLPIMTYGGQGTLKRGVHPDCHAIIYTSKSPEMKHGERITKKPVKMDPITPRDKLDSTSRINYAKVYTVEHNVKVYFVGKVVDKHEQRVVTDYNNTHQPLPDRPYISVAEQDYEHAEGEDPIYSYSYGGKDEHGSAGGPNTGYKNTEEEEHDYYSYSYGGKDDHGGAGGPTAVVEDGGQTRSDDYEGDQAGGNYTHDDTVKDPSSGPPNPNDLYDA